MLISICQPVSSHYHKCTYCTVVCVAAATLCTTGRIGLGLLSSHVTFIVHLPLVYQVEDSAPFIINPLFLKSPPLWEVHKPNASI